MASKFETLKGKKLADSEAKADYDRLAPEFDLASTLIAARKRARLSQSQLAERMATTQTVIARMESGRHLPTMKSIQRYAAATKSRVSLKLVRT